MALDNPAPTTELEAVNEMLASIVMAPTNTLEGTLTADIALAVKFLRAESRNVQSKGWNFNKDYDYPMTPNGDGNIVVADNILRIDVPRTSLSAVDVVVRGTKLYDKAGKTFTFTAQQKANIVWFFPFEELPQPARQYITIKAARRFQNKVIGSDTLDGFDERDEEDALTTLREQEGDNGDYNYLGNPYATPAAYRSSGGSFIKKHTGY